MRSCDKCPLAWEDRTYEGECNDAGCHGSCGDFVTNIWCFLPKFMGKIKLWMLNRSERKYYERMAKEYEKEEQLEKENHDCNEPDLYSHLMDMEIEVDVLLDDDDVLLADDDGESYRQYWNGYRTAVLEMMAYIDGF